MAGTPRPDLKLYQTKMEEEEVEEEVAVKMEEEEVAVKMEEEEVACLLQLLLLDVCL